MALSKLSKSDQNEKSIIDITREIFLKAKAREDEYEKIREMLRIKYGIVKK